MSTRKHIDIICDHCKTSLDTGPHQSAREAREDARFEGWRTSLPGGRDLCPDCR